MQTFRKHRAGLSATAGLSCNFYLPRVTTINSLVLSVWNSLQLWRWHLTFWPQIKWVTRTCHVLATFQVWWCYVPCGFCLSADIHIHKRGRCGRRISITKRKEWQPIVGFITNHRLTGVWFTTLRHTYRADKHPILVSTSAWVKMQCCHNCLRNRNSYIFDAQAMSIPLPVLHGYGLW